MTDSTKGRTAGLASAVALVDFDDVLAAAQAGAEWAMTALFRHFNPLLVRYLRAADPRTYEDVAAEVWLSAAPRLARFEGAEAEFRAWLFTIARNRLIDDGRRRPDARPAHCRRNTSPTPGSWPTLPTR
jgi:DNA-directed RNA polymerase specialized sigma24 family protein